MSPTPKRVSKRPFLSCRSSTWFIMLTVAMAVFTDIFLYAVVVPVLPFSLTERAQVNPKDVQHWTSILLGCYGFAVVIGAPVIGYYSLSFPNRRTPLFLGLVALFFATVFLAIGSSITVLALGRLFQGFSAAVVGTMGLALVADIFEQKDIGQAMGYVSLASSIAGFISPLLGGVVYSQGGYYAVFAMCFGLVLMDLLLRLLVVEKTDTRRVIDECLLEPLSSPGLEAALPEEHLPLTSPNLKACEPNMISTNKSCAHRRSPVISLLLSSRLPATLSLIFVRSLLLTSFDATLPLFVNDTFKWTSLGSGLIFLPFVLPLFLAPYVGSLADRKFQPRVLSGIGFFLGAPLLTSLRLVGGHSGITDMWGVILLALMLVGVGAALVLMLPPTMVEIERMIVVSDSYGNEGKALVGVKNDAAVRGQVYGLVNCAWALGTLAGPLWGGFVAAKAGWENMTLSLAALSAVMGFLAVRLTLFFDFLRQPTADEATLKMP